MKETRNVSVSTAKAIVLIAVITFAAAFIAADLIEYWGLVPRTGTNIAIEAILLSVLIALPVFWLVLKPLHKEYQARLLGEDETKEMSRMAITDSLTHIMNRRGITVGLLDAMAQAERYRTPLTVGMVDIDHFKEVNANHGHKAGDRVLKDIAAILSDALRMPDKVGRYGGEEFLVILPHTNLTQARKITDRIRASVSKWEFDLGDKKKINLTISIGVCQFKSGEDLEQFLSQADKALSDAKKGGRNQVVVRKVR